jgi:predicted phage terminase large subunit-like protein
LIDYGLYIDPEYQTPEHIHQLSEALELVEAGDIKRLAVFEPPRHGKSRLCSQLFPCWYLGRNPTQEVVQSGYSIDIALEHSRKARDVFASPENRNVFPKTKHVASTAGKEQVAVERQSAGEWGTAQGGKYYAVGVGGGLTGRGADLLIIDDPVKNREEAESPTIRKRVVDWYRSTAYTRLSPEGAIILIMTRWHSDDLAGMLIDEMRDEKADQWHIINMPAINENEEALWPDRFPLEKLEKIRTTLGSYEWSALYQQQPIQRGGNMLCVDKIQWHKDDTDFPEIKFYRGWDLASTEKERAKDDPDYTAGVLAGVEERDGVMHLWIKDVVAFQEEAPERNRRIENTAISDGPTVHQGIESVAGYKDAYTTIKHLLNGIVVVEKITVSKDKVLRAAEVEPIFEAGNVHILIAPWNNDFLDELAAFPSGKHDDRVDGLTIAHGMHNAPRLFTIDRSVIGI